MINHVTLIGRITRDPEVATGGSTTYCRYSIAINRFGQEKTDFINCVSFGKVADNMGKYLSKGSLIGIEGRIQSSSYKRQDGSNATSIEVIANNVQFLDSRNSKPNTSNFKKENKPAPVKVSIEDVNAGLNKFKSESISFDPDPKPIKNKDSDIDYDDIPWEI